ncbi:MAG TPA: ethanolamine ammonia-lyase subunit EutC [Tepidisphaeraceae bacterium]|jgi:ethanolamine ammonia-lyase small subunit
MTRGLRPDAWEALRDRTSARVALGRAGASLPTAELLRFALDHAEARDAVHAQLDVARLTAELTALGRPVVEVESGAVDHTDYLRHPDHGRQLKAASAERLKTGASVEPDVVLILADGLSATAANRHGVALVGELIARLSHHSIGPLVLARRARVALQDPIGHALRARCCVILIGERPGLGAADSLGAYLVFDPRPGRSDAERNCVSNIRPAGLPLALAADTIAYLIDASLSRRISGVTLKDDRPRALV